MTRRPPWAKRLAWLIGLWLASVGALSALALVIRWIMNAVGLTT